MARVSPSVYRFPGISTHAMMCQHLTAYARLERGLIASAGEYLVGTERGGVMKGLDLGNDSALPYTRRSTPAMALRGCCSNGPIEHLEIWGLWLGDWGLTCLTWSYYFQLG